MYYLYLDYIYKFFAYLSSMLGAIPAATTFAVYLVRIIDLPVYTEGLM